MVGRDATGALIADYCASQPECLAAWLFGSVARGAERKDSDVDVAVLVARSPNGTLEDLHLDWAVALERKLGRTIDLVVINTAPPELAHRVFTEGALLFERERSARVAFQVRSRNEYFDVLPFLRRYRRQNLGP